MKMKTKMTEEKYMLREVAEEKFCNYGEKIDRILNNHLPHLQSSIDKVAQKLDEANEDAAKYKISQTKWLSGILVSIVLLLIATLFNLLV